MTFEEWYKKVGFRLMSSGKSTKDILKEAFSDGYHEGFNEAKEDKDYEV